MNLLSTGPQSELNRYQTMTNAAFMKIERNGLLERQPHPSDRRAW
jgi:DNA-binding MarR family transcriptional regulator